MAKRTRDIPIFFLRKLSVASDVDVYGPSLIFELTTGDRFAIPISRPNLSVLQEALAGIQQLHDTTRAKH